MPSRLRIIALVAPFVLTSACGQADGIDRDGEVFDAISKEAVITLGGTEPFWSIEIVPNSQGDYIARYSNPENIEGQSFDVTRFAGNNGLGFTGSLEQKAVQIAITPGDCSDGMSDRTYPLAATAALGEETLLGCAYTSENRFSGPENP